MKNEKFAISGMTCSACSTRVEKSARALNGVNTVSVNLLTNSMNVSYDENALTEGDIIAAVEKVGYGAALAGRANSARAKKDAGASSKVSDSAAASALKMKQRLVGSICFWIPLMFIAMHQMIFQWAGLAIPPFLRQIFHGPENALTFAFSQFLLTLPILSLNRKYFEVGFKTLWQRSPNMDSLIAVGASSAVIYGVFAIFAIGYGLGHGLPDLVARYSHDLYFESAGSILTLITIGKYLESKSKSKTSAAIEKIINLAPKTAFVERNGEMVEIAADEVIKGDIVMVKPGGSVPVDGIILEGASALDESAITGESLPVEKTIGDIVISASINKSGFIRFRATKVGEDTTINQIIRLVDEAGSSKAPIAKMADKIAGVFVPTVMAIAFIAALIWLISGAGLEFALSIGISVLVISCPCALGLATPVAIMVGSGKGAENGILIKSGEALEIAHEVDTVILDKTGTITVGRPTITDIIPAAAISENELLRLAATLEQKSEHPLATAILEKAHERGVNLAQSDNFQAVFGKGAKADIEGNTIFGGNKAMLAEVGVDFSAWSAQVDALADEGKTPILFADARGFLGILAAADVVKPDSRQAVKSFQDMGVEVMMLTGDNERTAMAIQKRTGIRKIKAQVLPEEKAAQVAAIQKEGRKVAMVGDGVNDAPALAMADVGIAIGAGTDVAIESAGIVLMKNSLMDAVTALKLSKAVIRNIRQNLFWAFFYNIIGIPLAAGVFYPLFGWKLNPMFGAAAMSLSSLFVVSNALRLRHFKPETARSDSAATQTSIQEKKTVNEKKLVLHIEGMMCPHCQKHVSDALNAIDGVSAVVNLEKNQAEATCAESVDESALRGAVEKAGYSVSKIIFE